MDMDLSSPEMADFSFHGFSLTDIFGDSVFIIQPQSMSTTVSVNPKLYDSVTDELEQRYGMPEDKGQYGQIYRCWIENAENETGRVSITCYKTTIISQCKELFTMSGHQPIFMTLKTSSAQILHHA